MPPQPQTVEPAGPLSEGALLGPQRHPTAGPRWRVAVVDRPSDRPRALANDVVAQLRAAGCMAIEIGADGHDPFVDIDSQWWPAVEAGAYDLVLSMERLLPTAVVIATLAGVPVATVAAPTPEPLPTAIEIAIARGQVRAIPVLDVVADDVRQVTAHGIEVTTRHNSKPVVQLGRDGHMRRIDTPGCSITPIAGPTGQLLITTHHDDAVHEAHMLQARASQGALQIEIDGRARRCSALDVRGVPQGLRILDLTTGSEATG
jgi:hypothetical protein